jgi:hypothetical protein
LPGKYDWLAEGEIPADPLADFANTTENCLSAWLIDDDRKDLDDVVAALAASREKVDKLDYLLFPQDHLQAVGVDVSPATGNTPDEQVNANHRDLTHLSAQKVLALTSKVWSENLGLVRIDPRRVVQLVADAVRSGRIPIDRLRPMVRDDVRSCLAEKRDEPRKPR